MKSCPDCLRRTWLLAALAPYVERIVANARGRRASELLALDDEQLAAAAAPNDAGRLLAETTALGEKAMAEALEQAGCWACCRHHEAFPASLERAPDAPRVLIGRGDPAHMVQLRAEATVTVVGARRASAYGREVAFDLGRELGRAGMVAVSGMAFGIDGQVHRGALEGRGLTIAVLGCGADVAYPASHRALHRQISERGLVLSEFPPGFMPWRWTFPARNRVMAGLAGMTVVVEAAERSGSLITAEQAEGLHRDVGAVPGPVNSRMSAGPNALLAGGACVVRDAQDVLDSMLGAGARTVERFGPELEPQQAAALESFEGGAADGRALAAELGLSASEATVTLARLELLGYLEGSAIGTYTRTLLSPPP